MADGFGFGGNANGATFQMTMNGSAQSIPLPYQGMDGQRLLVTAGAADVYIGYTAAVTTSTGFRIPANITVPITACRVPMWAIGASGTPSFLQEAI